MNERFHDIHYKVLIENLNYEDLPVDERVILQEGFLEVILKEKQSDYSNNVCIKLLKRLIKSRIELIKLKHCAS